MSLIRRLLSAIFGPLLMEGSGYKPYSVVTIRFFSWTTAWGMPYVREWKECNIQADEKGKFSMKMPYLNEDYFAPPGEYRTWSTVNGVPSKVIHHRIKRNQSSY